MSRCFSTNRVTVVTVVELIIQFSPTSVDSFVIPYAGNFCQEAVNKVQGKMRTVYDFANKSLLL